MKSMARKLGILLLFGLIGATAPELGQELPIPGLQDLVSPAHAVVGRPLTPVSVAGVANVSYRRPSMSGPEETDHALVRVKGAEICLAWKQFGGGGDGCYPVSEEVAGSRYRLSTGPLWCDISPK